MNQAEEFAKRIEGMNRMDTVHAVADAGGKVIWATDDSLGYHPSEGVIRFADGSSYTDGQNMRLVEHI